ncbi:MAG: KUP/HAK/KT family potassium transporter [Nitrospinota bacterium]|nr:KUP/HAK/KT family potassium transporter [Nitrospinota bacterium]
MKKTIDSLGLVFGDIGTSPIYTLTVVMLLTRLDSEHIIGVLSLIIWVLLILVSAQYSWLAMSLSSKGEGGAIALREILIPLLRGGRAVGLVTMLSYISVSLMIGDGVLTPAISILSAVEGVRLIPSLAGMGQGEVVAASLLIAAILFNFQKRGTDRVAGAFGPVMAVWFAALAVSGALSILESPQVLKAFNPLHAAEFMASNGWTGFIILSEVILCATGGEALYADMGQIGAEPIAKGWRIALAALILNYLGQGAYILVHPGGGDILFRMVMSQAPGLYIPFLVLSVLATVIASQAMISGMFSIVYQGINTGMMPKLRIEFTSMQLRSQIFIGFVNWGLFLSVGFIMIRFGESSALAGAYGLAVAGAMAITAFVMTIIFYMRAQMGKASAAAAIGIVDAVFLASCATKIPNGGYWSLIIAAAPLAAIIIYTAGQRRLYRALKPIPGKAFLDQYEALYHSHSKIDGTALYFLRDPAFIPPYIMHTMFVNHILYEENILISITPTEAPFGIKSGFGDDLGPGLRHLIINIGYMETLDLEERLRQAGVRERVIFYGVENIATNNPAWRIFSVMKKLAPTYVEFYKMPSNRLHGVVTRVNL